MYLAHDKDGRKVAIKLFGMKNHNWKNGFEVELEAFKVIDKGIN